MKAIRNLLILMMIGSSSSVSSLLAIEPGEYASDANTILLLHMNETDGMTVGDASINGYVGNFAAGSFVPGRFGNAFQPGDYSGIVSQSFYGLDFENQFTWEAWVNMSSIPENVVNIFYSPYGRSGCLLIGNDLKIGLELFLQDGTRNFLVGDRPLLRLNKWYHVAATFDHGQAKVYVNGVLKTSNTCYPAVNVSNGPVIITGSSFPWEQFKGSIDEMRISKAARSPQEFDLQLPPINLTATASGASIELFWANGGGGVPSQYYRIYRGTNSTDVTLIDSTVSTSYVNTGLSAGTEYFYRVSAVDLTGFEGEKSDAASATTGLINIVATPSFDPLPGLYTSARSVTIQCATSDATIYYTTNGSDPTELDAVYTNPVHISSTTTLKARAYKSGWETSAVANGIYIINPPQNLTGEYASDSNTILLMHMNETGGTTVSDASSSAYVGTFTYGSFVTGRFGNAFQPSDASGIFINSFYNLEMTNRFTLEAWVKLTSMPSEVITIIGLTGNLSVNLIITTDMGLWLDMAFDNGTRQGLYTESFMVLNKWFHVAATFEFGKAKIYVNGDLVASGIFYPTIVSSIRESIIGGWWWPSNGVFPGVIDELRISKIARSTQEFDLQLPPINLTATASGTSIDLNWENGGGAVPSSYYKIYRGYDSLNVSLLDSTSGTTYQDTKVTLGASYFYGVSTVDYTGFEGEKSGIHVPRPLDYVMSIPKTVLPPVIDGHMDGIWSNAPLYEDFKNLNGFIPIESSLDCSPSFRIMWDNDYLYYYCSVTDDDLQNDDGGSYTDDSFEIYTDGMYSHGTSYDGMDDAQFRFPWNQNDVFNSGLDVSEFQFAQIDTIGGWALEVAMPLTALNIPPLVGHILGMDVQYEDDDNGGNRDHKMGWWQATDESWQNPSVFAKAKLGDQIIIEQPPVISGITAPIEPVRANTEISANAHFTDQGGTHTAVWYWGDGSNSAGTVSEVNGSGTVTGVHSYSLAGVYTVRLVVTDQSQNSAEAVFQYVVVFNPDAGFVTGGGWINSPQGAYTPDPTLTGKANFGFVSKYKKGSNVPTGDTQFQFKTGNLNFKSTSYEWLVISGGKAKYKGSGTINNAGDYAFMLTATDGDWNNKTEPDKFRIKIWSKDAGSGVVYDNQMGAADDADATMAIAGGSIQVQSQGLAKGMDDQEAGSSAEIDMPKEFALFQNYPNPFNPTTEIQFALPESRVVVLTVYNLAGQSIRTLVNGNYNAGYHSVNWDGRDMSGNPVSAGIYLFQIKAGEFTGMKKMILVK